MRVSLTADQTQNSTTLIDATGLSFSVLAGTTYFFKFYVLFQSAAAGTGIALGLTFPAVTNFGASVRIPVAADGTGAEFQGWITSSGDSVVGNAVPAADTTHLAVIEGVITPSADGTLQVQFANETGAQVVTIKAGSFGILGA